MAETQTIGEELAADVRAVEPPPREGRRIFRGRSESRPVGRPKASDRPFGKTDKELKDALKKLFRDIAPGVAGIIPGSDEYDAKVLQVNAERLAETYTDLAKASPPFRRFLEAVLTAGGPFAAAAFATMATVFPILHHHKIVSLPPAFGIVMIGEPLEVHPEETETAHGDNEGTRAADGKPAADAVAGIS